MPCPDGCDCIECLRRTSYAHWGLSEFSSSAGSWTHTDDGWVDITVGQPEFGRTKNPQVGTEG